MTTKVEKSVVVDVPVSTAYNQWTQFEEFPEFMGAVQEVEQLDDQRLRWVAQIGGVRREWEARILEQRPDEKIAWAATEGATNAGAVYFAPVGTGQSRITLELEYEPEGVVEKAGDALSIVERQAEKDVESFKTFIEGRATATGAWRGDVEGATVGTPGVESATSQGDSGKAGVSKTAMAAGAAAVAAGAAAVAATRGGGSDEESQASPATDEVVAPVVEEDTFVSEPVVTDDEAFVSEPVVAEAVVVEEDPRTDSRGGI
ncbi:SRPBCC family protein [Knoellia sp. CPCC 206435]|uniref:SRPBCC family protein n=1 Tax=Knoellia terrae TaxID=3404797 RepID=UPI003B4278DB